MMRSRMVPLYASICFHSCRGGGGANASEKGSTGSRLRHAATGCPPPRLVHAPRTVPLEDGSAGGHHYLLTTEERGRVERMTVYSPLPRPPLPAGQPGSGRTQARPPAMEAYGGARAERTRRSQGDKTQRPATPLVPHPRARRPRSLQP